MRKTTIRHALLTMAMFALTPCAQAQDRDPLEPFNRAVFAFNDDLDRALIKPVAGWYQEYTPMPVRRSIGNFFRNLLEPTTVINDLLQGKFEQALSDTGRFVANTTFGVLGLFDVATFMGMERHVEDFGQTFAVWGAGSGPYIVLPFIGPSNLRDGIGLLPFYFGTDPRIVNDDSETSIALLSVDTVNLRADLLTAGKVLDLQVDRYEFLRESYFQRRLDLIYDGNPPLEEE
jgi:phospholipid-binding lipoprotein MlaA